MFERLFCPGEGCPQRARCLRFVAERPARFNSFGSPPFDESGQCEHFIALPPPAHDEVARLAYQLWCDEGYPEGAAERHWFAALARLRP